MSKENTALALINNEATEFEVKKALYNLGTSAEKRLSAMVNDVVMVKAFAFADAQMTDKQTGEVRDAERVLVIDAEGTTYHSMSAGIVSGFHNIAGLFGTEKNHLITLDEPIAVEIQEKDTPKGHTFIPVIK